MNPKSDEGRARRARRRGQGPTVSEVAKAAGVSQMTVSRVVNGDVRVMPETRQKVEDAITALGYVPNPVARALAGGGQSRLALVYENPSAAFLSELLVGILEQVRVAEAVLLLETFSAEEPVSSLVNRLCHHRINGVLLPAPLCDDTAIVKAIVESGIAVGRIAAAQPMTSAIAVGIDDQAAAFAMTCHLIKLGHKRIGFIAGPDCYPMSKSRLVGYCRALEDACLPVDPALIVSGAYTFRSGMDAAETLLSLEHPVTAIFGSNDDMAAGAIAMAYRRGLDVPEQLSVCGFDDTAVARTVWPELTTVRQPVAEMASHATRLLVEHLRQSNSSVSTEITDVRLKFQIIERASAAAYIS